MRILSQTHLLWAVACAIALTSSAAYAVPPTAGPGAPPERAPGFVEAEQPLPVVVPPANDELASAEAVSALPFSATSSTLEATTAPDDPSCWGNSASVWYAYTPLVSPRIVADTFGSDYDTTLSAYTGAPGGTRTIAEPGQVNGNYAVWFRCTPACDVFLYDIAARTTARIPNPGRRQQYDPSVTSDGTVYFVRSGRGCGAAVRLVRHPLGGPGRVLASLGAGRDSFHTYALENDDGTTTVLFERVRCSTRAYDVLKLIDP
ncbi:MAG: hypothetical protein ACRDNG_04730 [Gaiellaceae bacterium]